jgi:hypothetical protein
MACQQIEGVGMRAFSEENGSPVPGRSQARGSARTHRVEARAPLSRYFFTAPVRTYAPPLPRSTSNFSTLRTRQHRRACRDARRSAGALMAVHLEAANGGSAAKRGVLGHRGNPSGTTLGLRKRHGKRMPLGSAPKQFLDLLHRIHQGAVPALWPGRSVRLIAHA